MLLIALGIAWLIHMLIIAVNGSIYFIENNPFILWAEISGTVLIIFFAACVMTLQVRRLDERRKTDRRKNDTRADSYSQTLFPSYEKGGFLHHPHGSPITSSEKREGQSGSYPERRGERVEPALARASREPPDGGETTDRRYEVDKQMRGSGR
jgi:hypothetical protein